MQMVEAKAVYTNLPALPPVLRRIDSSSNRFYYDVAPDGSPEFFPSVTTIIDARAPMPFGLKKWYADMGWDAAQEQMNRAAHYGTFMHILISEFLTKGQITLDHEIDIRVKSYREEENLDFDNKWWADSIRKDVLAFAQMCNEKNIKILAIEIPLKSRKGFAGTIDLVCELEFAKKTVRAIIDMKSGKKGFYETHEIQLAAYRDMWNENFPELPVTMVFNWSPKDWEKTPTYTLTNQTDSENAAKWPYYLEMYKRFEATKPKPWIECRGTVFLGRELTGNYNVVDVEEYLKAKHSPSNTAAEALVAADDF
ncbi:MAG: PD-(D/E)XK nuclease family protein [Bacteroidetes bacterium]|nr:PD-(D/E)XK nuclease family protein [Bacteroidota bacterium]